MDKEIGIGPFVEGEKKRKKRKKQLDTKMY